MAKKKKVRVAFKRNRQKRTRANDLTRPYGQGDAAGVDPVSAERVRAKGDLSRHRTIMQEEVEGGRPESDDPAAHLAIDLSSCLPGRVTQIRGLFTTVEADDGATYRCGVRRLLKTLAIDGRNVVAVGDRVWVRPGGAPSPGATGTESM